MDVPLWPEMNNSLERPRVLIKVDRLDFCLQGVISYARIEVPQELRLIEATCVAVPACS